MEAKPLQPKTSLKQINTDTDEGKFLIAAIGIIQARTGKTITEILIDLHLKAKNIYSDANRL